MKLDSFNSYRKDLNFTKYIMAVVVILCMGIVCFMYIDSRDYIAANTGKRLVVDRENRQYVATERILTLGEKKAQYERHVRDFYIQMFRVDAGSIDSLTDAALDLSDESGKNLYDEYYVEKQLERRIKESNWSCDVSVTNITLDFTTTPTKGVCYATWTIIRPGGELKRNMNIRFNIKDVSISYKNPLGALITDIDVFDNSKIE